MKNTLAFLSIISIGALLFHSCEKDSGPVTIVPVPPIDSSIHYVSFSGVIQPIFNTECVSCHDANQNFGPNLKDGYSWDQLLYSGPNPPYVDSINPENSILIQRLRGVELNLMPPGGPQISEALIDSIALWMTQGCRDN